MEPKEKIHHIIGCLYGQAIGADLGLGTIVMLQPGVARDYPKELSK